MSSETPSRVISEDAIRAAQATQQLSIMSQQLHHFEARAYAAEGRLMHATHQISGMAVRLRQAENRTMAAEAMVEMSRRETTMAVEAALALQAEYEQAMARAKEAEEGQRRLLEAASTAYMNVAEAQLSERVVSSASSRASSYISRITLPVVVEDDEDEEEEEENEEKPVEDPAWEGPGSAQSKSSKASSRSFRSCRSKNNLDLDEIERHYEEELRMMEEQLRIVQGSLAEALRMKSAGKAREVESDVRFRSLVRVTSAGNGQVIRDLEEMRIASERLAEDLKQSQDAIMELQKSLSVEERKRASLEIELAAAKDEVAALQALAKVHQMGSPSSSDRHKNVQSWLSQMGADGSDDGDSAAAKRKVEEMNKLLASKDKELLKLHLSFDQLRNDLDSKITSMDEVREEVERKLIITEADLLEAREYIRELEASAAAPAPTATAITATATASTPPPQKQRSGSSLTPNSNVTPFDLSYQHSNLPYSRPSLPSGGSSTSSSPNHPYLAKVLRHPSLPALSVNSSTKNTSQNNNTSSPSHETVVDQWFESATGRKASGIPPAPSRDAWGSPNGTNGGDGAGAGAGSHGGVSGNNGPNGRTHGAHGIHGNNGPHGSSGVSVGGGAPAAQHSRVKSLGSDASSSAASHRSLKAQSSTISLPAGDFDPPLSPQPSRVLRSVKSLSSSGAQEPTASTRKGSSLNPNLNPPQPQSQSQMEDRHSQQGHANGGTSSSGGGGGGGGGGFLIGLLDRLSRSPTRSRPSPERRSPPRQLPSTPAITTPAQPLPLPQAQADREVEEDRGSAAAMRNRRIPITGPPPMARHSQSGSGALAPVLQQQQSGDGSFLPVIKQASGRGDDWAI